MSAMTSITFGVSQSFPVFFDFDHIESVIELLRKTIQEFTVSKFNEIEFSTDLFDYETDGLSLQDRLLNATMDDIAAVSFLTEFERCIGGNKSYRDTQTMIDEVGSQSRDELPYKYIYFQDEVPIPPEFSSGIKCYLDACNQNSKNFKFGIRDAIGFTDKAKLVYEHIEFHKDFHEKLTTVKLGSFLDYLDVFSHALNTLNQAVHELSSDPEKNEEDLTLISEISSRLGKTLKCTREAKNKPHFLFPKSTDPTTDEEINCEYHLKLNFNDNLVKLDHQYVNRAYFGLKYDSIEKRKKIKLAHLGEHL